MTLAFDREARRVDGLRRGCHELRRGRLGTRIRRVVQLVRDFQRDPRRQGAQHRDRGLRRTLSDVLVVPLDPSVERPIVERRGDGKRAPCDLPAAASHGRYCERQLAERSADEPVELSACAE